MCTLHPSEPPGIGETPAVVVRFDKTGVVAAALSSDVDIGDQVARSDDSLPGPSYKGLVWGLPGPIFGVVHGRPE